MNPETSPVKTNRLVRQFFGRTSRVTSLAAASGRTLFRPPLVLGMEKTVPRKFLRLRLSWMQISPVAELTVTGTRSTVW